MSRKHKARQLEVAWDKPEAFSLVIEHALEGERVAKEKQKREAAQAAAEQRQIDLLDWEDKAKQYQAV